MTRRLVFLVSSLLLSIATQFISVEHVPIWVVLDTRPLVGFPGPLAIVFDLIDGDGLPGNVVTVRNIHFGGGTVLGDPVYVGSAFGRASDGIVLSDAEFFNEFFQMWRPGDALGFEVLLPRFFGGGSPDSFSFFILDLASGLPLPTLEPLGSDALLTVDLTPGILEIQTFPADTSRTNVALEAPVANVVPEPSSLLLVASALASLIRLAFRRA